MAVTTTTIITNDHQLSKPENYLHKWKDVCKEPSK